MNLYLHNSLTRKKELFKPLNSFGVSMYVCGPTVYDSPHIDNARSVVTYDILYRLLSHIYGKENIKYVRNITDVDDKINARAKELGITIQKLTEETTKGFHEDMQYLHCLSPNIEPRATEHIDDMIEIIESLIKYGHAYAADNHVYFDVTSYKDYGKLSGRNLSDMIAGARIDVVESKKHPGDFVLWKPASRDDDPSSVFESPWGAGRPGWHIECSAMSYKYLGENFDIHGGGADLIFPHHTNEIAQSCCGFPGSQFASTWVHNGFLTVGGEKMSKSLGNFLTIKDIQNCNGDMSGEILRMALLSTHYRKPLDFNDKTLTDATKFMNYLYKAVGDAAPSSKIPEEFVNIICDDLNTSEAFAWLHNKAREINISDNETDKGYLRACGQLLGLFNHTADGWLKLRKSFGLNSFNGNLQDLIVLNKKIQEGPISNESKFVTKSDTLSEELIEIAIDARKDAKLKHDFAEADRIRNELRAQGIVIEDTGQGTTWRRL